MSPCVGVKLNGRMPSADEELFLQRLYGYMEEKQTPIGRIPTLGFQKGKKRAKMLDLLVSYSLWILRILYN